MTSINQGLASFHAKASANISLKDYSLHRTQPNTEENTKSENILINREQELMQPTVSCP